MEYAFIVWCIGVLPKLGAWLAGIGCLSSIALILCKVIMSCEGEELKALRWLFLSVPVFGLGIAIPDKETTLAIAAAYGVQQVAENERVQKIAGQGIDVLEAYLEKTKKDLEKSAK
ncbi:hypothetical protein D3C85_680970 [compost metagenome]